MSREYPDRPFVGVGVVIWRGDELLLIQRGKEPRRGQWSIRVNSQWRVCFRFENGDMLDVEIVDYHQ